MDKHYYLNENRDLLFNGSGMRDITARDAIQNCYTREDDKKLLIKTILNMCTLAGFYVEEQIVLRDVKK